MPQQRNSGHLNPNESFNRDIESIRFQASLQCLLLLISVHITGPGEPSPSPPIRPVREITDEAIPSKVVGEEEGGANQSVMNRWCSVQSDESKFVSVVWDCVVDKKSGWLRSYSDWI